MKKSSMIFKMTCMAVCFALCLSVLPAIADDAAVDETVVTDEIVENVTETIDEVVEEATEDEEVVEEATEDEEAPGLEEATDEVSEESTDIEEEPEKEVLDIYATTLRDNGTLVTPGEYNSTVFDYNGVRYRVLAGTDNLIRLDGFESTPDMEDGEMSPAVKYKLFANGEVSVEAAHSGHFGFAVNSGKVIYRVPVTYNHPTSDTVYVFSAWFKMPAEKSISDANRSFTVYSVTAEGEVDDEYIVGYNEIGRKIEWEEDSWQQVLFTFRAPVTGLFQINFSYNGNEPLYMDDIELYEAEIFENPIEIVSTECTDADGNTFTKETGFATAGTLTHKVTLKNNDEDEVQFRAVSVLYKDNIVVENGIKVIEDVALPLDETEVTISIEIPEDEDHTKYKYLVYFIDDVQYTKYFGYIPSRINPFEVQGK